MTFRQSIVAALIMSASMALTGYGMWYIWAGEEIFVRVALVAVAVIINLLGMEVAAAGARSAAQKKHAYAMLQFSFALIVTGVAYFVDTSGIQSKFAAADDAVRVEEATESRQSGLLADARARSERATSVIPALQQGVQSAAAALSDAEQRRNAPAACGPAGRPATIGPVCREARQAVAAAQSALDRATSDLQAAQAEVVASDKALAELGAAAAVPVARSEEALAANLNDLQRIAVTWVFSGVVEFGAIFVLVLLGASTARDETPKALTHDDLDAVRAALAKQIADQLTAIQPPAPAPAVAAQPEAQPAPEPTERPRIRDVLGPRAPVDDGSRRTGRQREAQLERTAGDVFEASDASGHRISSIRDRIEADRKRIEASMLRAKANDQPPEEGPQAEVVSIDPEARAAIAAATRDAQEKGAILLKGLKKRLEPRSKQKKDDQA